jgi:transposase
MHRLQEFVRLHRLGHSTRELSRLLRMGRNTQRHYLRLLSAAGLLDGPVTDLPELSAIRAAVESGSPPVRPPQERSSLEAWAPVVEALLRQGAGPTAIFDKLRLDHPDFQGSIGAMKRLCRRLRQRSGPSAEDVAIPVVSGPGEVAQVDFGFAGWLRDPETGQERRAWVFVLVMAYSRHMFARIVFDQSADTWQRLHVEAFQVLGGVPHTLVPDNLKAAVVRASFAIDDGSGIQRGYRELARYYDTKIDPTPVRDPRKKGKVESGVKYVKRNFLATRRFADTREANVELDRWVAGIAGVRRHGTTGEAPLAVFTQVEQGHLRPLPGRPFEVVRWHATKVGKDAHVLFDRRLYSVPWQLLGQPVWVRASGHTVLVFHDEQRVATHARRGDGHRSTVEAHLPSHRVPWRHRSPAHWLDRAEALGPDVAAFVREVFATDDAASRLRVVQAAVVLLAGVSPERANAACRRAMHFGALGYRPLKRILDEGLDREPYAGLWVESPPAEATPRFARPVSEFVARVGGRP